MNLIEEITTRFGAILYEIAQFTVRYAMSYIAAYTNKCVNIYTDYMHNIEIIRKISNRIDCNPRPFFCCTDQIMAQSQFGALWEHTR